MAQASQLQKFTIALRESSALQQVQQTVRQPTFFAVAISVGLHAIVAASLPLIASNAEDTGDRNLDTDVIELSPAELEQFAPAATQEFGGLPQEFDFGSEFDGTMPPLSTRPSFPPPPPADAEEETPGSIWDRWSSWDRAAGTNSLDGRYDDYSRYSNDSFSQQYQDWVNSYTPPGETSPPPRDDAASRAEQKKLAADDPRGNSDDAGSGDDSGTAGGTEGTPGDDDRGTNVAGAGGGDSGASSERGRTLARSFGTWLAVVYDAQPDLEGRIETRQFEEITVELPQSAAYQVLVGQEVPAGVVVDPNGEVMSIRANGTELNPSPLPMEGRDRVLRLALSYGLTQREYGTDDSPRAFWYLVRFQAPAGGFNSALDDPDRTDTTSGNNDPPGEDTQGNASGGTSPNGSNPLLEQAIAYVEPLQLKVGPVEGWLRSLAEFENEFGTLQIPPEPRQVSQMLPPEQLANPKPVVFAIFRDPQGFILEDRTLLLGSTGDEALDALAQRSLASDEMAAPPTDTYVAELVVVNFVPNSSPDRNEPNSGNGDRPMKKPQP